MIGTLTARSTRLILVTAMTAAALVTAWMTHPARSHATPPPAAMANGFQDHSDGDYLRLQLDPSQANYGGFVAAIPGVGLAWPAQPATVSTKSDHSAQLRFDGQAYLNAGAKLDTEFGVDYQISGPTTAVSLRLIGQVDPAHGTGTVELWINDKHFHLAADSSPADASAAAKAVLTAIKTNDWVALYGLADSSLRAAGGPAQFAQQMETQFAGGGVLDAHGSGPITYTTTTTGISYANQPVSFTVTHDGATQAASGTLILIYNEGSWRWLTVKPTGS